MIGRSYEAVSYLENSTCDFIDFEDVNNVDIVVHYEKRGCGHAGASEGRISITNEFECKSVYDRFGLGLAVHELLHVLGHWDHDSNQLSVMNARVRPDGRWIIEQNDIDYIYETYCVCPEE
jgi:hypothetical protein